MSDRYMFVWVRDGAEHESILYELRSTAEMFALEAVKTQGAESATVYRLVGVTVYTPEVGVRELLKLPRDP